MSLTTAVRMTPAALNPEDIRNSSSFEDDIDTAIADQLPPMPLFGTSILLSQR